jgi:hypothetical protein
MSIDMQVVISVWQIYQDSELFYLFRCSELYKCINSSNPFSSVLNSVLPFLVFVSCGTSTSFVMANHTSNWNSCNALHITYFHYTTPTPVHTFLLTLWPAETSPLLFSSGQISDFWVLTYIYIYIIFIFNCNWVYTQWQ